VTITCVGKWQKSMAWSTSEDFEEWGKQDSFWHAITSATYCF